MLYQLQWIPPYSISTDIQNNMYKLCGEAVSPMRSQLPLLGAVDETPQLSAVNKSAMKPSTSIGWVQQ